MAAYFNLLIAASLSVLTSCTIDLNLHELQYVADRLTSTECRKLAEMLHEKKFFVTKNITGDHEPNKTCLYLLLKWDRTEGKGKTFVDLPLRLRQIGRPILAANLSQMVYREKSDDLKHAFLDDPFKKMIHKDSFLLDNVRVRKSFKRVEQENEQTVNMFWVTTGILSLLILVIVSFRICCPGYCGVFWRQVASDGAIEACDFCWSECRRCCSRFGRHYNKYVIGISERKHTKEDIQSLIDSISET